MTNYSKDKKPYSEKRTGNIIKRTFFQNVDENELSWHRDKEDRYVEVLNESDWGFQMDNELPIKLTKGVKIFIPKESYHRVIKGKTNLDVLIKEGQLEEEKKKRDRCLRKADSVYGKETSAYKSGAVVKCRQGKIWKLKENETDSKSDKEACLMNLSKKLIKQAHNDITRKKGKEYAPDVHELQAWIDEYIKNNGGKEAFINDNCGGEKPKLNEITSGDAYNKFYQGLFDKDNKENDKTLFAKYIELDPTFKKENDKVGEYTKWLFRKDNLEKLKKTKEEDLYKIKDDLVFFNNLKTKNLIPADKKDINKYNLGSLLDFVFDKQKGNEELLSNKEKERELKKDVKKYNLQDWTIIVPKTEEASCFYGKGTKWCTAGDYDNRFNQHNNEGPLYILINKERPSEKYQFHFESGQFMDVKDRGINLIEFFEDNDEVYDFFNKINTNLDFFICQSALRNYDVDGFDNYYSDKFDNEERHKLIKIAFERESDSYGSSDYYMVDHILYRLQYEGMKNDFKDDFLYGLESSLENKYDEENRNAIMFIDYLGGFNEDTIDDIVNQVNFKSPDEIEKIFNIAEEFGATAILTEKLKEEDIDINFDMLDNLEYLKNKFYHNNNFIESKLAKVKINKINFDDETLDIDFIPKDENGQLINTKKETGKINYKNLYKYLTNPQLFESEKNIETIKEKWSEKYKRTIDCNNPKGFSQKAHCAGRKKRQSGGETKSKPVDEAEKTDFSKEKKQGLHGWFSRRGGGGSKGWVDCNTCKKDPETGRKKCKSCGRQEGEKRAKYPACRPTPSACGTKGKGKSWGKKSVKETKNENIMNKNKIKTLLNETFGEDKTQTPTTNIIRKNKPFLPIADIKEMSNSKNTYRIYHETLAETLEEIQKYVKSKGYDELEFGFGDVQHVNYGTTNKIKKELYKDGQLTKNMVIASIYRMDSGRYELTVYTIR